MSQGPRLGRVCSAFASIAQLAEHAPRKRKVASSILAGGYLTRYSGRWSRGMILRSGRRGRGFDSRTAPDILLLGRRFFFSSRTALVDHKPHLPLSYPTKIRNVRNRSEPRKRSSAKIGTIQRRLAWPLRKDDTHKSRMYHFFGFCAHCVRGGDARVARESAIVVL